MLIRALFIPERSSGMYIFPGYTRYYEENGAIYVTSDVYQSTIKLTDPALQKEFYSMVQTGGYQSLTSPLSVFLHEQGLVASKDEICAVLEETWKLLEDTLMITILPTESCNFRCPYCYESHVPISMRRETLDLILKYIKDQAPRFKLISLGWFGGEPTLCKDVVIEANGCVQTLSNVEHIRFESSMTNLWSNTVFKNACYTCKDVLSCFNMRCKRNAIVKCCSNSSCSAELSKIYE